MTNTTGNMIKSIYNKLYDHYGPQGWWPLLSTDVSAEDS